MSQEPTRLDAHDHRECFLFKSEWLAASYSLVVRASIAYKANGVKGVRILDSLSVLLLHSGCPCWGHAVQKGWEAVCDCRARCVVSITLTKG